MPERTLQSTIQYRRLSRIIPKKQTVHPQRENTLNETERLQLARQAFADYYARCFWYMRRDLEIGVADIPEIARGLRLHGGRQGFILAARLCP